ncbi:MAG: polysaccharide biosynthesis protein, partial [Bacteroidota bacterium]
MIRSLLNRLTILPRWVIIVIDLAVFLFAFALSFNLRFNFDLSSVQSHHFGAALLFSAICAIVATVLTESYAGIVRYTGLDDGIRILYTCLLYCGLLSLLNLIWFYNTREALIPFSILLIAFFSSFIFLFFYRLLVKSLFQYYKSGKQEAIAIAVYGTASTGIITSHILDTGTKGVYKTVAFFEEDQTRAGKQINGIRIYNFHKDFETVISSFGVKELIITGRDLTFDKKNEIVDICLRNDVKIKSIPPVENWVHGELSLNQIREISLEDLLGRESIQFANPILTESIRGKRVCVTGAAGSIGSELCRQIITYEPQVMVLIDQSESALYELELELDPMREGVLVVHLVADITNRERMAA